MRRTLLLLMVWLCGVSAATRPIGMALTNGSFKVDHSTVWGTATLFDGTMVETEAVLSQLHLTGGPDMRLGSGSRATVYQRKLVLDYGQLESAANYEVEANSLHIVAAGPDGLARVQVRSRKNVLVSAARGAVRVMNAAGVLVANIDAGKTLNLEPQGSVSTSPVQVSGCLLAKGEKIFVADQTANVLLEVHGTGLDRELGNRVAINGIAENAAPAVAGASQAVRVVGLKRVAAGGCADLAKKLGATAAAGAAAGTAAAGSGAGAAAGAAAAAAGGIGAGTVAVIGGVAAAAALGSLGLAGDLPGQSSSPTVSR